MAIIKRMKLVLGGFQELAGFTELFCFQGGFQFGQCGIESGRICLLLFPGSV